MRCQHCILALPAAQKTFDFVKHFSASLSRYRDIPNTPYSTRNSQAGWDRRAYRTLVALPPRLEADCGAPFLQQCELPWSSSCCIMGNARTEREGRVDYSFPAPQRLSLACAGVSPSSEALTHSSSTSLKHVELIFAGSGTPRGAANWGVGLVTHRLHHGPAQWVIGTPCVFRAAAGAGAYGTVWSRGHLSQLEATQTWNKPHRLNVESPFSVSHLILPKTQ